MLNHMWLKSDAKEKPGLLIHYPTRIMFTVPQLVILFFPLRNRLRCLLVYFRDMIVFILQYRGAAWPQIPKIIIFIENKLKYS